jgi:hypothetical protein
MMKCGKAEMKKFMGAVYAHEKNQKKFQKGGPRQKYLRKTPYFRLISTPIKPKGINDLQTIFKIA